MNRPVRLPRQALRRPLVLAALPAILLAGCQSREAEMAKRNEELAALSQKKQDQAAASAKRPKAASDTDKQSISEFYGHGSDDGSLEGSDDEADEGESGFLDPTSDYFDNSYAIPESDDSADDPSDAQVAQGYPSGEPDA